MRNAHFKLAHPEKLEPCACPVPRFPSMLRYARMLGSSVARPHYAILCAHCERRGPLGDSLFEAIKLWNGWRLAERTEAG